jgi:hypothetical protein
MSMPREMGPCRLGGIRAFASTIHIARKQVLTRHSDLIGTSSTFQGKSTEHLAQISHHLRSLF